jgi:hypothetical protein
MSWVANVILYACGHFDHRDRGCSHPLKNEPAAMRAGLDMIWNWIGRSQDEIEQARRDWTEGTRFGEVKGYDGAPLPAPELPATPLKPRGRRR